MSDNHDHSHEAHDHHEHGHSHGHGHNHGPKNYNRAFAMGIVLNVGFVVVESVYGYLSNSLALISDAGHNLSDVLSLLLAWGATLLVQKRPTQRFSYGLKSSSILASLANAIFLLLVIGAIAWEAIIRFQNPAPIAGATVMWVAGVGIFINGFTAFLFAAGSKGDLNIRGAFQHMLADAVVSLGVVLAGLTIVYTGWLWLDPVVSLVISAVIVVGTWGLLRESLNLALNAVPSGIDREKVFSYLSALPGVKEVHDLHIWGMSTTETAMTVHLLMPQGHSGDVFLENITRELESKFQVHHATIQIECGDGTSPCKLAPDEIV
jgi:cobalt-zinc-cadmium efflux system protein